MSDRTTVLLTGGTGFVGSRIARRLLAAGASIRSIVRRPDADPSLQRRDFPAYEEIVGDFVDPSVAAKAAEGCDLVIHAAATAGPDVEPVRRVNVDGTRSMLGAARAAGAARYVQISTISVYEVAGLDAVDEDAPLKRGADPYGTTKAEGDALVLAAMAEGLGATILRPGAILGLHPTSTWALKVPARVRDRQVKLLRDGGNTLPFVHVEDLVDAVSLSLSKDRSIGRVFNVLDTNRTWREYTDEVRRWFDAEPLESVPENEAAAMTYWTGRFVADRIRTELGWAPSRTFADGMGEAEAYWRQTAASPR
jgi:nucleoside-diphosphate-sugar epimerase